jgi:hypothetical protein
MSNPYQVLSVDPDASDEELQTAYRERILEAHPDQGGSTAELKRVKTAYEKIQSDSIAETTKSATSNRDAANTSESGNWSSSRVPNINCARCGTVIIDRSSATFRESTEEAFCPDCVVTASCEVCGTKLTITADQYADAGGSPVCSACSTSISCSYCGTFVANPQDLTVRSKTGDAYCPNCIVETVCDKCGKALKIAPDRFKEIGPIVNCESCGETQQGRSNSSRISEFLTGVVQGLKYVSFLLSFVIVGAVVGGLFALTDPQFTVPRGLVRGLSAIAGPGLLILLWKLLKSD